MSALARYFKLTGKNVAGYDRIRTSLTNALENEGIPVHYEDSPEMIPDGFRKPEHTLVIYTPAVPKDQAEYTYLTAQKFRLLKRSEILGMITREHKTVAVAGTHGKTTVSTMIAHIMAGSQYGCNAFLGGISKNFSSNLVMHENSDWIVTEADEFDRSFLQLYPYAAVVTAMDADHLDIYGYIDLMHEAFNLFIGQIDRAGILLVKAGLRSIIANEPVNTYTYSLKDQSDFYAVNIQLSDGKYSFDLVGPHVRINRLTIEHPGLVNVENAVAASAMCVLLKVPEENIRNSLATFSGIQRRFDYQLKTKSIVYIDDYAHHPREIEATLNSIRELYPHKKITAVFQPHLYSRTRDFADDFAESLSLADRLILLDIYPARELPIEGVSSEMIFRKVSVKDKVLCRKEELLGVMESEQADVVVTLGAGDIDKLVMPIKELLQKRIG